MPLLSLTRAMITAAVGSSTPESSIPDGAAGTAAGAETGAGAGTAAGAEEAEDFAESESSFLTKVLTTFEIRKIETAMIASSNITTRIPTAAIGRLLRMVENLPGIPVNISLNSAPIALIWLMKPDIFPLLSY